MFLVQQTAVSSVRRVAFKSRFGVRGDRRALIECGKLYGSGFGFWIVLHFDKGQNTIVLFGGGGGIVLSIDEVVLLAQSFSVCISVSKKL